jgi:TRAP-type C4-dicarboxylate transport system substrate-binding protein
LIMATGYIAGATRWYPTMQLDFKENIQNMTNGEVYVNLALASKLGSGGKLAKKVQSGVIQIAIHAMSNLAPFAPDIDLINIPYWASENQKFVNLITSPIWNSIVIPKVEAKGFKILANISTSSRTFTVRKGFGAITNPDQMRGVKMRVPGSKLLRQFYRMLGANPTPIAWGETPSAIKQGVADALDPTINGLVNAGFADIVSNITMAHSVHGGQVWSANLAWFQSLPKKVQEQIEFAGENTFRQNLAKLPASYAYSTSLMRRSGVKIHELSKDQVAAFAELGGYQRKEWDPVKIKLAGSLSNFKKMFEAANTQGKYIVYDV